MKTQSTFSAAFKAAEKPPSLSQHWLNCVSRCISQWVRLMLQCSSAFTGFNWLSGAYFELGELLKSTSLQHSPWKRAVFPFPSLSLSSNCCYCGGCLGCRYNTHIMAWVMLLFKGLWSESSVKASEQHHTALHVHYVNVMSQRTTPLDGHAKQLSQSTKDSIYSSRNGPEEDANWVCRRWEGMCEHPVVALITSQSNFEWKTGSTGLKRQLWHNQGHDYWLMATWRGQRFIFLANPHNAFRSLWKLRTLSTKSKTANQFLASTQ